MSLAVFSLVIEVTSFSRIVICNEKEGDLLCVCVSDTLISKRPELIGIELQTSALKLLLI